MESPTLLAFFSLNWLINLVLTGEQLLSSPPSWSVWLSDLVCELASYYPSRKKKTLKHSGPIASYFTNRYGCRAVTIAGAILASAGLALSCAANSIVVLYLTIGILTGRDGYNLADIWLTKMWTKGLGFGLIYLPAIVSVSIYFEKKRAFATGIAVCGSGVGTFIMAPVTKG